MPLEPMTPERWVYAANFGLPSLRANAVQVLNQCAALIRTGVSLELVISRRWTKPARAGRLADLKTTYGLDQLPTIRRLPCLDLTWLADRLPDRLSLAAFYGQHLSYLIPAAASAARAGLDVAYTREPMFAPLYRWLGGRGKLVIELHDFPSSDRGIGLLKSCLGRVDGVVTITRALSDEVGRLDPGKPILTAPDGAAESFFTAQADPGLKQRFGLPDQSPVVMYAGGLYWAWKGVTDLIEAIARLPEELAAWLVVVGDSPEPSHLDRLKNQAKAAGLNRVVFTGYRPPAEIPALLQAADALALPNSAKTEISRRYTSPLKLFEYLASGRPVVASDLPSLGEILIDRDNALLTPADDPAGLARTLQTVLTDPGLAARLGRAGRRTAEKYTWRERARRIRAFAAELQS